MSTLPCRSQTLCCNNDCCTYHNGRYNAWFHFLFSFWLWSVQLPTTFQITFHYSQSHNTLVFLQWLYPKLNLTRLLSPPAYVKIQQYPPRNQRSISLPEDVGAGRRVLCTCPWFPRSRSRPTRNDAKVWQHLWTEKSYPRDKPTARFANSCRVWYPPCYCKILIYQQPSR